MNNLKPFAAMFAVAQANAVKTNAGPMPTADQAAVERIALRLLERPELEQAHAEAKKLFLAYPNAQTPAGRKTLDPALNEMFLGTVYDAILADLSSPRIFWVECPPHRWADSNLKIGGARFAIDNPDNFYRMAIIDPVGHYEVRGHRKGNKPIDFSVQLYADFIEKNRSVLDTPMGSLLDKDILVAADGSYTLTVSPEPANGRPNHIQSNPRVFSIVIRTTLSDWATETSDRMEIRRLDKPAANVPESDSVLAARAVARLKETVPYWLKFIQVDVFSIPANTFPIPFARGGDWGFSTFSNFKLAADEGLLITIHPQGAGYTGFQLTDPWGVSCEYIQRSGSLNNSQARHNADGSHTYVIAAKDPGVANWMDTEGLDIGTMTLRWQSYPQQPPSADGLLREVKLVKLADLDQILPKETPRLTPAQRVGELAMRAKAFEHRLVQ